MTHPPHDMRAVLDLIDHEIDHAMDQALTDRHNPDPHTRHTTAAYHTGQLIALAKLRDTLTRKDPTT